MRGGQERGRAEGQPLDSSLVHVRAVLASGGPCVDHPHSQGDESDWKGVCPQESQSHPHSAPRSPREPECTDYRRCPGRGRTGQGPPGSPAGFLGDSWVFLRAQREGECFNCWKGSRSSLFPWFLGGAHMHGRPEGPGDQASRADLVGVPRSR